MYRVASFVALVAVLGCDPGYFKRFPIDDSEATSSIEAVLIDFDREHLGAEFFRTEAPASLSSDYRARGYRVLRWYDRDRIVTAERGSFVYLAVLVDMNSSQVELASGAFPSFGEPPELKRIRQQLSEDLCARGFRVSDACEN